MDPESKQLLQDTFNLTEENNKMLQKVRGVQKRETLLHFFKFIIIVGIAFGSFYFIEPYLDKLMSLYNSVSGTAESVKNVSDGFSLKNLLEKF